MAGRRSTAFLPERSTGKLLTLDETFKPALPALLSLLDVQVEDQEWQALDPPQRRQRTLDACKRLLLRESQVQPLLLVFEDLHWIDTETQAFLDGLIDGIPTARTLLLVNYRPEYQHAWAGKTYYTQLRIDPLPAESAEELLQALVGGDPSLQAFRQLLTERTKGNPFFMEESVRTLVETGVLVGREAPTGSQPCWKRSRCRPRSRPCWPPVSTGSQQRRSGSSRPPPLSAKMYPSRFSGPSPNCPRMRYA